MHHWFSKLMNRTCDNHCDMIALVVLEQNISTMPALTNAGIGNMHNFVDYDSNEMWV